MTAGRLRRLCALTTIAMAALAMTQAQPRPDPVPTAFSATSPVYGGAPVLGTLVGTQNPSATNLPQYVKTSAACPSGTDNVAGYIDSSASAGWAGIQAIDPQSFAAIATNGVALNNNLIQVAAANALTLANGHYDVAVVCYSDPNSIVGIGQFNGGFTIAGTAVTWDVAGSQQTSVTLAMTPPSTVTQGNPITLTATLSPAGAVGTVQFTRTSGATTVAIGSPVTVTNGAATTTVSDIPAGSYALGANYVAGSSAYLGSVSPAVPYVVLGANQQATTTTLVSSPSGSASKGAKVTLTAQVQPAAAGTVTFLDGTATVATAPVVAGTASVSTTTLAGGSHSLLAAFTPTDAGAYAGSQSPAVAFDVIDTGAGGGFLGFLIITQDQGTADQNIDVKSTGGCPAPADTLTYALTGPGAWASGVALDGAPGLFNAAGDSTLVFGIAQAARAQGVTIVPGAYTLMVACRVSNTGDSVGIFAAPLWFYDSQHWLSKDPAAVGIPTTVTLTVSPQYRGDLGAMVTMTAVVTPASVAGKIDFQAESDNSTTLLKTVTLSGGIATLSTSSLTLGLYYFTAVLTPDTASPAYRSSTSDEAMFAAVPIVPPGPPARAIVVGTPKLGSTLDCQAAFTGATTTSYQWFRDGLPIAGRSASHYQVASADHGHRLSCRASATNAGGTVYRDSAAVTVVS